MGKWLIKSEPLTYSIDDLKKEGRTLWDGVRNYQARNFLMEMEHGDEALFYHSNTKPPGIVGVAKVSQVAIADPSQFDKSSEYYDPKATEESPRWYCPEFKFQKKFKDVISLQEMREDQALKELIVLRKGNRLSVLPVEESEFKRIIEISLEK